MATIDNKLLYNPQRILSCIVAEYELIRTL